MVDALHYEQHLETLARVREHCSLLVVDHPNHSTYRSTEQRLLALTMIGLSLQR